MSSAKNFMPHYVGKQKTSAESVALSSGEQTSADSASSKGAKRRQSPNHKKGNNTTPKTPNEAIPGSGEIPVTDINKLHSRWIWYYDKRSNEKKSTAEAWEGSLRALYEMATVESFARVFNHMPPPSSLGYLANFHFFRSHIKPMWEDGLNADGGEYRYTFSLARTDQAVNLIWREVIMLLIGELIDPGEAICGVVFSRRHRGDRLAIWTKSNVELSVITEIGERLTKHLTIAHPPPTPAYAYRPTNKAPHAPLHMAVPIPDLAFEFLPRGASALITPGPNSPFPFQRTASDMSKFADHRPSSRDSPSIRKSSQLGASEGILKNEP